MSAVPTWGNAKVAYFETCRDEIPTRHPSVWEVLNVIIKPPQHRIDLIERIRKEPDKDTRNRLKRDHLPAVTFACDMSTREKGVPQVEKVITWAVPCLDFDDVDDPESKREALGGDLYVSAAFLSPSGTGLKVLVRFSDSAQFLSCWQAAVEYFKRVHGLHADPARKDVMGLCFMSYDPNAYVATGEAEAFWPSTSKQQADTTSESDGPTTPATTTKPTINGQPASAHILEQAREWLAQHPPAIDGDGGSAATYTAAVALVHGFCLGSEQALELLIEDYNPRCQGPWTKKELEHKVDDAITKSHDNQRGWLIRSTPEEDFATPVTQTASRKLHVRRFSDTIEEKPIWIWPDYIPRKCTSILGGKQGGGKGLTVVDLVARASRGDPMPDGTGGGTPLRVLIITREDDPAMALKPRLRAARAIMDNVSWSYGDFGDDDAATAIATMKAAAPCIEAAVVEHGIDLVIIDPLGAWIEEDGNSSAQVRAVIDPMNRMALRTGCAVMFVAHLRKAQADDPMDAFAGSFAVTAAVRVAISITKLNGSEYTWTVTKTNFRRPGAPMVWSMAQAQPFGESDDPPIVVWRTGTQADAVATARQAQRQAPIVDPQSVLRHMVTEHRPINDEARRIQQLMLPSVQRLTLVAVKNAMASLVKDGEAHEGKGTSGARTIGTSPQVAVDDATDRAVAAWERTPGATVRQIAKAAGCSSATAGRARRMALSHGAVP